jgi:hypothetical protein
MHKTRSCTVAAISIDFPQSMAILNRIVALGSFSRRLMAAM